MTMGKKKLCKTGQKETLLLAKKQHMVYGTQTGFKHTWLSNSADNCTTNEYHRLKFSFAPPYLFSQHASLPSQSPPVTALTVYVVGRAQSC